MIRMSKEFIVVSLCILFLAAASVGPIARAQTEQSEQQAGSPAEDTTVLVEASVVQVDLSRLYDLGVSPIVGQPESVSLEHIVKCLRGSSSGKVIAGARLATNPNEHGETSLTERRAVRHAQVVPSTTGGQESPVTTTRLEYYDFTTEFTATPVVKREGVITVLFAFSLNTPDPLQKTDAPPVSLEWQWEGAVALEPGKSAIVGGIQSDRQAVFLILCANIMEH
jgi:hypothetical protein